MKVHALTRRQEIPRAPEEVFAFFERPENLARLTPPELGFVILTPKPLAMRSGAVIDYTVRVLGVPVRWTTLITDYDPPYRFVDLQLRGPYAFWHHTHTFERAPGGTLVTDEVRYALPFGWLGSIAHTMLVSRQLRNIFDYRQQVLERMFAADMAGDVGEAR